MKTNRSASIAKKRMREKNSTSDRPEQLLVKEILEYHVTGTVTTEVKLRELHPVDALNFTGEKAPRVDIVLRFNLLPTFLIRVNGPSHDTDKREKYDKAQKIFLELQKIPYRVIDVSYVRHEILFERNKRKLTKIELYQVLDLLRSEFLMYGIKFSSTRTSEWIENSKHRA